LMKMNHLTLSNECVDLKVDLKRRIHFLREGNCIIKREDKYLWRVR
jgi:hypothetical protein